jgi:flagellar hook-associated protein 1 FlgK
VASASNQGPILPGVTLSNVRALQPSDYELSSDINGSFTLTRLSDGHQTQNLSDGAEVDGLTISLGSPPPEPGDRFLIQSVSQAAQQMSRVQDDPRALAAANPVTAAVVAGNTGTASIESLVIDAAPSQPYQALTLAFTDNAGNYEWRDGSGTALAGGQWQAGSPISYNGMELSLSGAPRSGDRIDLKPTTAYSASNGNALAMVSLGQRGVVDGASLADAYAAVLAGVGVRVQSANTAEQISTSVAAQAEQTLSSQTGVNLDEEAAKLIQFQQSYQAAAKVLQVAQKVFDTLLGIAN